MHTDAKSLMKRADKLFSDKKTLDSRNQAIADHFYPERANFTVRRDIGEDWAAHLMTGYPSLVRRDLGNSIGSMLRPRSKEWFEIQVDQYDKLDSEGREFLQYATRFQRRAMYDKKAGFNRATKEGDMDFAAFGQCAITVEFNPRTNKMLYRNWHTRDLAWAENYDGEIDEIYREWEPTCEECCHYFPRTAHPKLKEKLTDNDKTKKYDKTKVRQVVIKTEKYDPTRWQAQELLDFLADELPPKHEVGFSGPTVRF